MFAYTIEKIADDCWDLYVSDDDGFTWQYFASYVYELDARTDGEWACSEAKNKESYTI
jgi:hypothetical protein